MADDKIGEGAFELRIDKNASPAEAVRLALKQEIKARKFYEECAKVVNHPGAKKMFEFLAGEERKHEDLIQKELDRSFMQEM
jgi:rubrerythrin